MKKNNTIEFINLGCSKNLVDSEHLSAQLQKLGYNCRHDSDKITGSTVVVNTCGFIGDAKEESINTILNLCELKRKHKIEKLFVMGCLSERYLADLEKEIPEVDKYYGKFTWKKMIADLGHSYDDSLSTTRDITTPKHYAYLKISEGCNRRCSYCAIPIITGPHKSIPMEELVDEAKRLVATGVKELQVIAQDLSSYGKDLYGKVMLPELVEKLSDIPGVEWIRLHYAYPSDFPWDLLRVMNERSNVCKYLDVAFQHITTGMLKKMLRHVTKEETIEFIERVRREVPGITLRTTFIVGHPGETEEDFNELLQFVKDTKFDRMGAFAYSEEEGTYSARHYKDDIPFETKQERLDALMKVQERIALQKNGERVGQKMKVICDREDAEYFICRTEFDSPEVDQEVLVKKAENDMQIGEFYNVEITDCDYFDLFGKVAE